MEAHLNHEALLAMAPKGKFSSICINHYRSSSSFHDGMNKPARAAHLGRETRTNGNNRAFLLTVAEHDRLLHR